MTTCQSVVFLIQDLLASKGTNNANLRERDARQRLLRKSTTAPIKCDGGNRHQSPECKRPSNGGSRGQWEWEHLALDPSLSAMASPLNSPRRSTMDFQIEGLTSLDPQGSTLVFPHMSLDNPSATTFSDPFTRRATIVDLDLRSQSLIFRPSSVNFGTLPVP